jgi:hypothetical protein
MAMRTKPVDKNNLRGAAAPAEQKYAMIRSVPDQPEEVIMAVHDKTLGETRTTDKPLDPQSLSFIERIFYFEHQSEIEADNDNKNASSTTQGSACFDSWAMPDFMRG